MIEIVMIELELFSISTAIQYWQTAALSGEFDMFSVPPISEFYKWNNNS